MTSTPAVQSPAQSAAPAVSGATVVVSATQLTGQMLENFDAYDRVLAYPQKTILNHSLHVFQIPAQ